MAVAGLTRLRKHQFGRQSAFGTAVAATKVYPYSGVPDVNLSWTDPQVDVGSLDPVVSPYHEGFELTAALTDPAVWYNCLPLKLIGFFGKNTTTAITPTGAGSSKTWTITPHSTSVDDPDVFTYQFGDDVTTDWYQLSDGIIETLEFTGPDTMAAVSSSDTWRFGRVKSTGSTDYNVGSVPTSLAVETGAAVVYLKDAAIYIASTSAGLGAGQVSNALHSFTLRLGGGIDQKRYANGTQSFEPQNYARADRSIELELTFAKTSATVGTGSESDAWMSEDAIDRFVKITFTSLLLAETAVPYSWTFTMPMRYYTRSEGEIGGNSTVVLTGHAFYDAGFGSAFTTTVVNTLASATL